MANRYSLDCPIDGVSLVVNRTPDAIKIPPVSDQGVGTHAHVEFNTSLTCSNGHTWLVRGDLLMIRTA